MKIMLDAKICIYLINRRPASVLERFKSFRIGDISVLRFTVQLAMEHRANALRVILSASEESPLRTTQHSSQSTSD